jgi:iron(III) transport system ATP-binding protein
VKPLARLASLDQCDATVPALEFRSISRSFDGRSIIQNLSLSITPVERIVLFGASGCGKTTLLRMAAGLDAPDSGTILLHGSIVADSGRILVASEHRRIGMVFQDLALWPHMTVRGNLEFGLKARGIDRATRNQQVEEVLTTVGLVARAGAKPHQLSGGEQQRVALARALVLRPGILLMDEPLSSLDEETKAQIVVEIVRLQESLGFTLLYVTHDLQEMHAIATRVVKMSKPMPT